MLNAFRLFQGPDFPSITQRRDFILRLCIVLAALISTSPTVASPVLYSVEFTVDTAFNNMLGEWEQHTGSSQGFFSEMPDRGNTYFGSIGFDDSLLGNDGDFAQVDLNCFRLDIADLVWDASDTTSQFWGFLGSGQVSKSPVLQIRNHELEGFSGDVFGRADFPFTDFLLDQTFASVDLSANVITGQVQVAGRVPSVPEPNGFMLCLLGIGFLAVLGCLKKPSLAFPLLDQLLPIQSLPRHAPRELG